MDKKMTIRFTNTYEETSAKEFKHGYLYRDKDNASRVYLALNVMRLPNPVLVSLPSGLAYGNNNILPSQYVEFDPAHLEVSLK